MLVKHIESQSPEKEFSSFCVNLIQLMMKDSYNLCLTVWNQCWVTIQGNFIILFDEVKTWLKLRFLPRMKDSSALFKCFESMVSHSLKNCTTSCHFILMVVFFIFNWWLVKQDSWWWKLTFQPKTDGMILTESNNERQVSFSQLLQLAV